MRYAIAWLAALMVPILLLAGPALAQKAKKPDADVDKSAASSDKMIKAGTLVGKVSAVYEDKRKIRLAVTTTAAKINPGAITGILNAQNQMLMARTIQGRLQAQAALMRAQAGLYRVEQKTQYVELAALDDVLVRTARPREQFDEKGKIKKFTRAELKELKGDSKQPGYKAEFSDVQTEQIIQVTLVRKKGTPAPKAPRRPKKGKEKEKEAEVDIDDNLPQISRIMILVEPPPSK
jgi:preprotein translocase subunit YajC